MDPVSYFVPWYMSIAVAGGQRAVEAVNYRASLNLNQFEEADRYAMISTAPFRTRTCRHAITTSRSSTRRSGRLGLQDHLLTTPHKRSLEP